MHNTLPLFTGHVQKFYFPDEQAHKSLLGDRVFILQRAAWLKGLEVHDWRESNGDPKWHVFGENKSVRFREAMPCHTTAKTREITNNKEKTKSYLRKMGIQTPSGVCFNRECFEIAVEWFDKLENPNVVAKPVSGTSGKDVYIGIKNKEQLLEALRKIKSNKIVLEEFISGSDYRLLVVGGKLIAAIKRHPAFVVGDGEKKVEELIENKNLLRRKNPYASNFPIVLDDITKELLFAQRLKADSVLEKGRKIVLKKVANIGAGGESEEILSFIHEDFFKIAESCWHAFPNLAFCGIDLIAEDISQPMGKQKWGVIEINANCDLSMHHFPLTGEAFDVSAAILDYLFGNIEPVEKVSVKVNFSGIINKNDFGRFLTRRAVSKGLTGYYNCKNNNHHVVFEGSCAAIKNILKDCSIGPKGTLISSMDYQYQDVVGYDVFNLSI